ncbi:hypothetical protein [Planctomicrobium sp. SH527]|uniref:hypothetical protein n=1 Tax=Planctomicrobium sp. SH527 TaxID=3448123 RepID=UPI003F5BE1C0
MQLITAVRIFGALFAAVVTALILLIAVEFFSSIVHPPPADFKGTQQEIDDLVKRYPDWVLALVVPMWGFTAFICTWIAGRIGNRVCAASVGFLFTALVVCNTSMLPYPVWFKILMPIIALAAVILSYLSLIRRSTPATLTTKQLD